MPTVRTNDFDCHYQVDDFAAPWTTPETVLVQHGFGRNGRFWYAWAPPLAQGYRVLRRDMRGHGGSSDPGPDYAWSVDVLVNDVRDFLDALDIERVHYIGESLGGITGIAFAATNPDRLASLTLVATPLAIRPDVQELFARGHPDWPTALGALGSAGWGAGPEPDEPLSPERAAMREWTRQEWERTPVHVLQGLARFVPSVDAEPLLPKVAAPTLILAPSESPITPLAEQFLMRERIPDARIHVLDGYGHGFYQEVPERCTRQVVAFLDDPLRRP